MILFTAFVLCAYPSPNTVAPASNKRPRIFPPQEDFSSYLCPLKEIKIIILESNTIPLETVQSFILLLIQEGIEVYDILPSTPNDVINYIKDYNVSKTFIIDKQKIKRR